MIEGEALDGARQRRLRDAFGGPVDPSRPLFSRDSETWRVQREAALLLAGGRALLLQVAHPLVAAGVARHSDFESRPLDRLRRTLDLTLEIVFAPARDALRAVESIEGVHDRVRGELGQDAGSIAAGTRYDADRPALLWWVYATLLDSSVVGYRRFVGALDDAACQRLYAESAVASRLFGIPDSLRAPDWPSFRAWFEAELGRLQVSDEGRAVAQAVLNPSLPWGLSLGNGLLRSISLQLLPGSLRDQFGFARTGRASTLRAVGGLARALRCCLPPLFRVFPRARRAARHRR